MQVEFIIPGEVTGKGRPRFKKVGNFSKTYTDEKTVMYENLVKTIYANDVKHQFEEGKCLSVDIRAYYNIPKSESKKTKIKMASEEILPTKKPDCDNIAKIILDSLNGVAYKDDSQVVSLSVRKTYSLFPKVKVTITDEILN